MGKVCITCRIEKEPKDYYKHETRCAECEKARKREARKRYSHVDQDRKKWLKYMYGLSVEQFKNLEISQNRLCAICGNKEQMSHGRLSIDHCHTTNKIRGLLCSKCNTGLGQFKDNIKLLEIAINYLRKWQT